MHEELNRPLSAAGEKGTCECKCTAAVREGESASVENVRLSNNLATKAQIGG